MLSSACKYAIRSLIYISLYEKNKIVNSKHIASKLDIPEQFTAKILQTLARHNILKSYRGIAGGFALNKSPKDIYFIDIIKIFDGLEVFHTCVLGMRICTKSPKFKDKCPFRNTIDPLMQKFYDIYSTTTIGDFTQELEDFSDGIFI